MKTNTLIVGLQGAGKSTKAREIIGNSGFVQCDNAMGLTRIKGFPSHIKYVLIEESSVLSDGAERGRLQMLASAGKFKSYNSTNVLRIPNLIVVAQCKTADQIPSSFKEKGWNVIVVSSQKG